MSQAKLAEYHLQDSIAILYENEGGENATEVIFFRLEIATDPRDR